MNGIIELQTNRIVGFLTRIMDIQKRLLWNHIEQNKCKLSKQNVQNFDALFDQCVRGLSLSVNIWFMELTLARPTV